MFGEEELQQVDIGDKPYATYLELWADKTERGQALTEALDYIWEHEEGRDVIERAASLTEAGALPVYYSDEQPASGLQLRDEEYNEVRRITLSPLELEYAHYTAIDGSEQSFTMSRLLAHELYHAADPNVQFPELEGFNARFMWQYGKGTIENQNTVLDLLADHMPENYVDMSAEEKRALIDSLWDDDSVQQALQELSEYDGQDKARLYQDDQQLAAYRDKVESPAIAFANRIMEGQEIARDTRYIENLPPSVPAMLQEKESFEYVAGVYMDNIAKTSLEETRALLNSMSDGMVKQHEPGALVRQADYQQPLQAQAPEKQR
jgi:hypothetical protein